MCRSSAGTYKHPARPGASEPAVQRYGRWALPGLDGALRRRGRPRRLHQSTCSGPEGSAGQDPSCSRAARVSDPEMFCASRGWKAVSRETGDADDDVDSPDSVDPLPPDALLAATEPTAPIPPSTRRARRRRGPGEVVGRPRPPPGARCSAQGPHRKIRPIAFPNRRRPRHMSAMACGSGVGPPRCPPAGFLLPQRRPPGRSVHARCPFCLFRVLLRRGFVTALVVVRAPVARGRRRFQLRMSSQCSTGGRCSGRAAACRSVSMVCSRRGVCTSWAP